MDKSSRTYVIGNSENKEKCQRIFASGQEGTEGAGEAPPSGLSSSVTEEEAQVPFTGTHTYTEPQQYRIVGSGVRRTSMY